MAEISNTRSKNLETTHYMETSGKLIMNVLFSVLMSWKHRNVSYLIW